MAFNLDESMALLHVIYPNYPGHAELTQRPKRSAEVAVGVSGESSRVGGHRELPQLINGTPTTGMATLAPVDSRKVVRCDHCLLVQFPAANSNCRRCHASLEFEPIMAVPPTMTMSVPARDRRGYSKLAISIRSLRLRSGLSQRQLAGRMSVAARSYISKVENDVCMPTLSSLERLARALDVSIPELLGGDGDRSRQEEEVGELMKDEFIAQLVPFIVRLNALQMSGILLRIRDMLVRRRSA